MRPVDRPSVTFRAVGRAVAAFEDIVADQDGELGVGQVALPVELLAAGPLAFDELLAHGLAREVERTLADGRVAVRVDRAEGVAGKRLRSPRPSFRRPQMKQNWLFFGPKSG